MSAQGSVATLALVALVSGAAGVWVGHSWLPSGAAESESSSADRSPDAVSLAERLAHAERERRRLEAELHRSQARAAFLEERQRQQLSGADAETTDSGDAAGKTERAAQELAGVDWQDLERRFRASADLIATLCALESEGKSPDGVLSPEQLAEVRALQAEWVKAASKTRVVSQYPVIDAEILPAILQASLGGLLDLSDAQLASLAAEALAVPLSREELESATPLEAYVERRDLVGRLESVLPEVLDDHQLETWSRVGGQMLSLLRGEPNYTCLGLEGDEKNSRDLITRAWREHYAFSDDMTETLGAIADDYIGRARGLIASHGDPEGHLRNLEGPVRAGIESDMLALQLEFESKLLDHMSESQLEGLTGKQPWLVQFERSTAVILRNGERMGF